MDMIRREDALAAIRRIDGSVAYAIDMVPSASSAPPNAEEIVDELNRQLDAPGDYEHGVVAMVHALWARRVPHVATARCPNCDADVCYVDDHNAGCDLIREPWMVQRHGGTSDYRGHRITSELAATLMRKRPMSDDLAERRLEDIHDAIATAGDLTGENARKEWFLAPNAERVAMIARWAVAQGEKSTAMAKETLGLRTETAALRSQLAAAETKAVEMSAAGSIDTRLHKAAEDVVAAAALVVSDGAGVGLKIRLLRSALSEAAQAACVAQRLRRERALEVNPVVAVAPVGPLAQAINHVVITGEPATLNGPDGSTVAVTQCDGPVFSLAEQLENAEEASRELREKVIAAHDRHKNFVDAVSAALGFDNVGGDARPYEQYLIGIIAGLRKPEQDPIPMLLWCPVCGTRHVDAGEFATRSHRDHSCQACGLTWRPAKVATVGVRFLPGYKDA